MSSGKNLQFGAMLMNFLFLSEIVVKEVLAFPIILLKRFVFWRYLRYQIPKNRRPVSDSYRFYYCVHEWLGYDNKRVKNIKNTQPYDVGFSIHEDFIKTGQLSDKNITSILSLSGEGRLPSASGYFDQVLTSNNYKQDFSGHLMCADFIGKDSDSEAIVLFSNTSLGCIEAEFVLECFSIYESDTEIGILGISSSAKKHQTIVPISYSPHVQTFFFVVSNRIFTQFIESKKNFSFPVSSSKYNLIREWEIALSDFVLRQGLSIAVLECNGKVSKYHYSEELSGTWEYGDMRAKVKHPASACFEKS